MVSDPAASARNQQNNTTAPVWTATGAEQEWRAIGLVMMPEEFETLLYADSYTSEKMCKRGILQSCQASWMVAAAVSLRWLPPDQFFATSHRGNSALWRRAHVYKTNPNGDVLQFRLKHSSNRSLTSGSTDYLKLQEGSNGFAYNLADCDPNAGGSVRGAVSCFDGRESYYENTNPHDLGPGKGLELVHHGLRQEHVGLQQRPLVPPQRRAGPC
jgi:hypothetical protein